MTNASLNVSDRSDGGIVIDNHFYLAEMVSAIRVGMARLADSRTDAEILADHQREIRQWRRARREILGDIYVNRSRRQLQLPLAVGPRPRARASRPKTARRTTRTAATRGSPDDDDGGGDPEPPRLRPSPPFSRPWRATETSWLQQRLAALRKLGSGS